MAQREALKAVIQEIGFIRSVTVNRRTGNLIDGHERVWQALTSEQPLIDVEYVDLSEEDERKALATLDPISEMAVTDPAKLDELLRDVQTGSAALQEMLAGLQSSPPIEFSPAPDEVQSNIDEMERTKEQRKKGDEQTHEKNDTERYLVLVFPSRAAKETATAALGLPGDERYVPAESLEIRPKRKLQPSGNVAASSKKSGACG